MVLFTYGNLALFYKSVNFSETYKILHPGFFMVQYVHHILVQYLVHYIIPLKVPKKEAEREANSILYLL